jgi:hypothetical protein
MGVKVYHQIAKAHVSSLRANPKEYAGAMHHIAKAKAYSAATKIATGGDHPAKVKKFGTVLSVASGYAKSKGYHH